MNKLKQKDTGFTMVANKPLCDKGLSLSAKGLYAYLRSKPEGWQFSADRIALDCLECVRTIKAILQELEDIGLLTRQRKSSGRVDYIIEHKPQCKKATVQNLHGEESAPISNTELNSNTELYNNTNTADKSAVYDFKSKLSEMLSSTNKRMPVIAKYWHYKGLEYDTGDKYRVALKRELRPASDLIAWPIEKIEKVMFWLNGTKISDWKLETVIKYIDKDLEELSKNNNFYN
jgi:hypothetical protein